MLIFLKQGSKGALPFLRDSNGKLHSGYQRALFVCLFVAFHTVLFRSLLPYPLHSSHVPQLSKLHDLLCCTHIHTYIHRYKPNLLSPFTVACMVLELTT